MNPHPTVLVVDDDENIQLSLRHFLGTRNFRVLTASSYEETFDVVARERPHVVLLDLLLVGKSGIDVLERLRKSYPSLPVIVLSGVDFEAVGETALALGAYAYLTKPFSLRQVEQVLLECIRNKLASLGKNLE